MEDRPAYVPLSSIPATEPDPSRIGVVRNEPGQPFEHYCAVCGRWGGFGVGVDPAKGASGTWYCAAHVPAEFWQYRNR